MTTETDQDVRGDERITTETDASESSLPFARTTLLRGSLYAYLGAVYVILLLPILYVFPALIGSDISILLEPQYSNAIKNSFLLAGTVGVVTTILATIAARYYRYISMKKTYIIFMTLPLFVPGDIHTMAIAIAAKNFDIGYSFWTLMVAHVFYTFPFAFLVILAAMANLPNNVVSAAQDLGASGARAFFDTEFPLIQDGVVSGFLLAFLLSFSETARASSLGGIGFSTVAGLLLSYYETIGLNNAAYVLNALLALMAIVIVCVIIFLLVIRD